MKNLLPYLLPKPQQAELKGSPYPLNNRSWFIHVVEEDSRILQAAEQLGRVLNRTGVECRVSDAPAAMAGTSFSITLSRDQDISQNRDGYELQSDPDGIRVTGSSPSGLFYGIMTCRQLIALYREGIESNSLFPNLYIQDSPDFCARGIQLDVSRDRIPTMETLFDLVDLFARLKYNQLQLYFEHVFAYQGHEAVWKEASSFTPEEIRTLDAYCRDRFIELVPNQNSFGHFSRWLIHEEYRDLAECPEGFDHIFSLEPEPFSLNPLDPRCINLLEDLYDQLLPCYTSRLFNVGLDEAFDLGEGRSSDACAEGRKPQVYLDFVFKVYELVRKRSHTMMYWGDVVFEHPQLIDQLPRDAVALLWGYEADHPFAEQTRRMKELGLPYYVCPGTSSWNSLAGRTDNLIGNMKNAASHGKRNDAAGILVTDWGDNGHLQPLPVSYPGFAAGAAAAWNAEAVQVLDLSLLSGLLDRHIFNDLEQPVGRAVLDLGNIYRLTQFQASNFSSLFLLLGISSHESGKDILSRVSVDELEQNRQAVEALIPQFPERGWIGDELRWVAEMLMFSCDLGVFRIGGNESGRNQLFSRLEKLIERHKHLWLRRNRPGGLKDSVKRLQYIKDTLGAGNGERNS